MDDPVPERREERSKSFADKARAFRRRTAQKVMVKLGKADSSVDEEFEELTKRFFALDANLREVHRDLSKYIEAKRTMLSSGSSIAEDVMNIFDRQAPLRHLAIQFKDLQTYLSETVKPHVDSGFLEQVLEPVEKQMRLFDDIKARLEKRSRLMLDYDSYRRKVKAISEKQGATNAEKKAKKEAKLQDAFQKFSAVNERLVEELHIVDENKSIVLQRPLVALLKLQSDFYTRAYNEFKKVSSILSDPSVERTIKEGEELQKEAYSALGTRSDSDPLYSTNAGGGGGGGGELPPVMDLASLVTKKEATTPTSSALVATAPAAAAAPSEEKTVKKDPVAAAAPPPPTQAKKETKEDGEKTKEKESSSSAAAATTTTEKPKKPEGSKPAGVKCKALYAYEAAAPTELSLQEGEMVTVLKQDDSGWWQGQVGQRIGWFPFNYVEVVK